MASIASHSLIWSGRLFQRLGTTSENAQSPHNLSQVLGTFGKSLVEEQVSMGGLVPVDMVVLDYEDTCK